MIGKYTALTTETTNTATADIDLCSTEHMLELINDQDQLVPFAVRKEITHIAAAVDLLAGCLQKGGRMIYVGAGTSGRLGVLDASECPPTFSTSPQMIQAYIAGGDTALRTAVEGCEDDAHAGAELIKGLLLTTQDVVIGITASGSAPYVIGAVKAAKECGASTICVVNNAHSALGDLCDISIEVVVGPEVIRGSTRMKSGTAQKLVLNMLTTGTMIRLGKVYGNLMVDLHVSNQKLYDRAIHIVKEVAGVDLDTAEATLKEVDLDVKRAIVVLKASVSQDEAAVLLTQCGGRLRDAIAK